MAYRCTFLSKFLAACVCILGTTGFCIAADSGSGSSTLVYVGTSSQSGINHERFFRCPEWIGSTRPRIAIYGQCLAVDGGSTWIPVCD